MKRTLILALCALLLSCCTKTPQQKAEALVKDAMLKSLILPDTYQPVETKLDSAFSPYHSPEYIQAVLDLCQLGIEIDKQNSIIKRKKSSMSIWSGSYMSAFGNEQYRQAKEECETAENTLKELTSQVQKRVDLMRMKVDEGPKFIGYMVHHRYRAQNNAGNTLLEGQYFLLDADVAAIVCQWSEEDIELYNTFLQQMSQRAE